MSKFLSRLRKVGIGRETSRGTGVAASYWLKKLSGNHRTVATTVKSIESFGNIHGVGKDAYTALKHGEGSFEMELDDTMFGLLLYNLFGALSTSTDDPEASTNTHTITVDDDSNQHPALTIHLDDPNQDKVFELGMIESAEIIIVPDDLVKINVEFKSMPGQDSVESATFLSSNKFLGRHLIFNLAATTGALADTKIPVKELRLRVEKNLLIDNVLGTVQPADVLNQSMMITGSVTLNLENETYKDYDLDKTQRAMRIKLKNTDVTIGTVTNPTFTIDFSRVFFESWDENLAIDEIATQTLDFTAMYDTTNSNVINSCTLINEVTSY